ncbi:MAG: hypothetical protein HFH84_08410 [Lachnospiraceae bacterium]|nr:hypothetical protein [Lachnospiraceae bacterium]
MADSGWGDSPGGQLCIVSFFRYLLQRCFHGICQGSLVVSRPTRLLELVFAQ